MVRITGHPKATYKQFNEVFCKAATEVLRFDKHARSGQNGLERDAVVVATCSFVDDKEIQRLNAQTRNIDKTTDVLSFPFFERGETWYKNQEGEVMLGDIVINIKELEKDCRHVTKLFTHGFLHLLGYDHESDDDWKAMQEIEDSVTLIIAPRC